MLKEWQDVFHQPQKKGNLQHVSSVLEYNSLAGVLKAKD
jgi:hypothetical protein